MKGNVAMVMMRSMAKGMKSKTRNETEILFFGGVVFLNVYQKTRMMEKLLTSTEKALSPQSYFIAHGDCNALN